MKRVDFGNGRTLSNIAATALPMFAAQALNLLYNIVDRIYIARIPVIGTAALGAVGLCFPIVILITAFTNMFGSGGAPLFSISRGAGDRKEASGIQNTSFFLLLVTAILLTLIGELAGAPVLRMFGASDQAMVHALPYLRIYLIGTVFSMISTGMNPFINAQGYSMIGMTTVMIGAVANIILDPVMIFVLGLGVEGAAIATILSQALSAVFVLFFLFGNKVDYRQELRPPSPQDHRARYGSLYHAADQQSGYRQLQSGAVTCRRRYLCLDHDHYQLRQTDAGNTPFIHYRGNISDHQL